MRLRVLVSGRHYDLAATMPGELTLPDGCSVDGAIEALQGLLPSGSRLPESCLVAVSGIHLGTVGRHQPRTLRDGDELLVLAPIAGG